jgi:hypothetical protein
MILLPSIKLYPQNRQEWTILFYPCLNTETTDVFYRTYIAF